MTAPVTANIALEPGGILSWIIVGLIAGALASRVVQGRGLGCLGDIIVGVVGAFIGAFILGLVIPSGAYGPIGTLLVAFLGAVILLLVIRLVTGRRG